MVSVIILAKKKAGVAILMSDKVHIRAKNITGVKDGYTLNIKGRDQLIRRRGDSPNLSA